MNNQGIQIMEKHLLLDQKNQYQAKHDLPSLKELASWDTQDKVLLISQIIKDSFKTSNQTSITHEQIDQWIIALESYLQQELNFILKHPDFKRLESTVRSIQKLMTQFNHDDNIQIDLINTDKQQLALNIKKSNHLSQLIYNQEYDMPGGQPYAVMIATFSFNHHPQDIDLLSHIGEIAQEAHCPFIANIDPSFFQHNDINDKNTIEHINTLLQGAEYTPWHQLRKKSISRYLSLCLPQFLLRLPYGQQQRCEQIDFHESINRHEDHCWGPASIALGCCLIQSFKKNGWAVHITGPQSGGMIHDLPLSIQDWGEGPFAQLPIEYTISERLELKLSSLGLIPLSYYKNSECACFFSAHSLYQPSDALHLTTTTNTTSNPLNTQLSYLFLTTRLSHYLKVLQRENIGAASHAHLLETQLNEWIGSLVTTMNHPSEEAMTRFPLRQAKVTVTENNRRPGFYHVNMQVVPHIQTNGIDIELSCTSWLPKSNQAH